MLNLISGNETAAATRARFGMGAVLPSTVQAAQPACAGAEAFAHRRASWARDVFQPDGKAAGLGVALGQRNSRKPYPHTTRIVPSGDARGPHPPREPV